MYSKTFSVAIQGIEGHMVQIEADISDGLPVFSLVGDLSCETKEAKERVRVALQNTGFRFPPRRVTVNLSPADIRKDGTGYDLAIAVAVLSAYGYISKSDFNDILFIGELSLEGEVRPVNGVLPMVYAALAQGVKYCILSRDNQEEASVVREMKVIGVTNLRQAVDLLEETERCTGHPEVVPGQSKRIQQNRILKRYWDRKRREELRRWQQPECITCC